jgi:hypothetical protein
MQPNTDSTPVYSHDPSIWHLAQAPGVRELTTASASELGAGTLVYDGDLQIGHPILPELCAESAGLINTASPTPCASTRSALKHELKKAMHEIFEGDLQAGDTAMLSLIKVLELAAH